jgi:SHS2 domain-containing protein
MNTNDYWSVSLSITEVDREIHAEARLVMPGGGELVSRGALVPVAEAEITGAAPKAASLHDLRCAPDAAGRWSCAVTVDV